MIREVNSTHCLPCRTNYTMDSHELWYWMTICTVNVLQLNYYCHYL